VEVLADPHETLANAVDVFNETQELQERTPSKERELGMER
jgi:hypothetical protein